MDDKLFFEGNLVALRAMEPEDLDFLYHLENDTALWEHGIANVPYSRYALRKFIEESQNDIYADHQLRLIIELKGTKEAIGCIDLFDYSVRHHRAEIGLVVDRPFQRLGAGREALSLLLHYAFGFLRLHQLYVYVACANLPAVRLFEQAGFERAAVLKDWIRVGRAYHPVALYTLCMD